MFQANQQIGGYTLIKQIGKGGFGEVWLAEKRSPFVTKKVAIKLPLDEQINFEAIRQEASLWEQASGHANILPIIDADIYDGQVVIVSEYAEGGSLFERLQSEGKFSPEKAVEMTLGILNGLDYLHSQKIIHRDIKPQNILLQRDTPRLADFGISRAMEGTTNSVTVSGTDAYMAPEAFEGKRNVQTDVWSVGVVLYQLLSGKLPFPQANLSERMFAILTREFSPLPYQIPAELKEVVQKSLAKNPGNRYSSAIAMHEDLKKALIEIQKPDYVPRPVVREPSDSELTYPGGLGVTGIIPHGAWGVSNSQSFYATSDSPETVIAFYEEKFGKGELDTNSGAVKWRFNDSFNKNYKTISVFPETAIALFSKRGDVRGVPQNTKSLIILESLPWEESKDNSTVTDVVPREISLNKTEPQAKDLPTVAVLFADKTNKRRISPLIYIGAGILVLIAAGIIGIVTLLIFNKPVVNTSDNSTPITNKTPNSTPTATPFPNSPNTLKNSIGMEFVKIPAGSFMMGSDTGKDNEKPVHKVTISNNFYLGKYEVTQAQWKAVMGSLPKICDYAVGSIFVGDNKPIVCVSWDEVQEFIKKLNANGEGTYRLPTEAEWEYAARARTTGDFYDDVDKISWNFRNSDLKPHEVGTKQANAFGLYDMSGNVSEWCSDWYGTYPNENVTDPTGAATGSNRVIRGGYFGDISVYVRSPVRENGVQSSRKLGDGFRLLRTK